MRRPWVLVWICLLIAACTSGGQEIFPVPIRLSPSPSSTPTPVAAAAPVVATVECSKSGTTVSPEVQARANGITFLIRNTKPHDVVVAVGQVIDGAEPHEHEHARLADGHWFESGELTSGDDNWVLKGAVEAEVWVVPPGRSGVACLGLHGRAWWPPEVVSEFTVVDPGGLYHPLALSCEDAITYGISFPFGADSTAALRDRVRGLRKTDVVEYGEYPDQRLPRVRIVRDGRTVGIAYRYDVEGDLSVCRDTKIRPAGVPPPSG